MQALQCVNINYEEHNERVIKEIEGLAAKGRLLGCFVCRLIDQSLPQDKERTWVSLDIAEFTTVPQDGRLHLKFDVQNRNQMQRLQGLFDRVVLDWTSILCCIKPYKDLGLLLRDNEEAQLVIEAIPGGRAMLIDEPTSINVQTGRYGINVNDRSDLSKTGEGRTCDEIWKQDLCPQLKAYMGILFKKVVYHENEAWPYDHIDLNSVRYFTLIGPKVEALQAASEDESLESDLTD